MYYITCPEVTINFAHFPMTPTGREVTLIEQATGTCVDNAEVIDSPTYLCKGDGKWSLPTGGCKCKAGFEPDFDKQTCNGKPHINSLVFFKIKLKEIILIYIPNTF